MSSSPTPTDPERGEGKGSNDDDDDPAEDFEDDPDSEAAADAQQTLDEIDNEITASDSDSDSDAGASGGDVAAASGSADVGTGDESLDPNPEPGRNGLASNPTVLDNAFEYAQESENARDTGIDDGNTTADDMEVLEMEDGSRVFATPVSTYPTMVVDSEEEAINNNLRSPQIVNALGGHACKASITEDSDGNTFIVREGVEGVTVKGNKDHLGDATATSAEDTMAAAYFVGNQDLHGANMVIDTDDNVTIIDHDSAGEGATGLADMRQYTRHNRANGDSDTIEHKVYDNAHQIVSGEQDLPVAEGTDHYEYANKAATKAVRRSYVDPSYDAPSGNRPSEMQSAPDGVSSTSDFGTYDRVQVVDKKGSIVDGTVVRITDQAVHIDSDASYETIEVSDDSLNRVVEVE